MTTIKTSQKFRTIHRYLGFFLAGIMMVYALSGTTLIFRKTDFLKFEQHIEKQLPAQLTQEQVQENLGLKEFSVTQETATRIEFNNGSYDRETGMANYSIKDYPVVMSKLIKLHKATHKSPLYYMNIVFGFSLLFFAVSSFFMFIPKATQFKTGIKVAAAGFVFALIMVMY